MNNATVWFCIMHGPSYDRISGLRLKRQGLCDAPPSPKNRAHCNLSFRYLFTEWQLECMCMHPRADDPSSLSLHFG